MKPAGPTPETPTKVLVELAREGNSRAFELLIHRHRVRMYCVAMRYLGNYDDASDICQDAMSRAWERLHLLQDPECFPSWMEQIVVHLCLDLRRRLNRRPGPVVSLDAPVSPSQEPEILLADTLPADQKNARQTVLEQEISTHLLRAIDALPGTLREAAYLRFVEGANAEHIAARLAIDYEAARKRVYRATLELRRRLQPLYDELMGSPSP